MLYSSWSVETAEQPRTDAKVTVQDLRQTTQERIADDRLPGIAQEMPGKTHGLEGFSETNYGCVTFS